LIAAALLVPSLFLLFAVFKGPHRSSTGPAN
jgi:hypothetical protein